MGGVPARWSDCPASEIGAVAFGLAASLSCGVADFIGGIEAPRLPVLSVLLLSQPVGLSVAAVWAPHASGRPRGFFGGA